MTKLFSGLAAALLASTLAFACSSDDNGRDPGNDTDDAGTSSGNTTRPDGGSSSGGSSSGGSSSGSQQEATLSITNLTLTPTTFAVNTAQEFTYTATFEASAGIPETGIGVAFGAPEGVTQSDVTLAGGEVQIESETGGSMTGKMTITTKVAGKYSVALQLTDNEGNKEQSNAVEITAE